MKVKAIIALMKARASSQNAGSNTIHKTLFVSPSICNAQLINGEFREVIFLASNGANTPFETRFLQWSIEGLFTITHSVLPYWCQDTHPAPPAES